MARIPDSEDSRQKIDLLAELLEGTCMSLDDGVLHVFGEGVEPTDLDNTLLQRLDNAVALCEECGWWDDASDFEPDSCLCSECRRDG